MEILFEKQDCHGTLAAGCRFGNSAADPGQPLAVAIGEHPNQALATFAGKGTILSAPRMAEAETPASVQTVGAIQSSAIIHVACLAWNNPCIFPQDPKPQTGTIRTAFFLLRTLLGSRAWYCGISLGFRGGPLRPFAPACDWIQAMLLRAVEENRRLPPGGDRNPNNYVADQATLVTIAPLLCILLEVAFDGSRLDQATERPGGGNTAPQRGSITCLGCERVTANLLIFNDLDRACQGRKTRQNLETAAKPVGLREFAVHFVGGFLEDQNAVKHSSTSKFIGSAELRPCLRAKRQDFTLKANKHYVAH